MEETQDPPYREASRVRSLLKLTWRGAAIALFLLLVLPGAILIYVKVTADPEDGVWSPLALFGGIVFLPLYPFLWAGKFSFPWRVVFTAVEILLQAAALGWFTRGQSLSAQMHCAFYTFFSLALLGGAFLVYVGMGIP